MDNHAISNGFISKTIAFFAYVILIVGLLAAGAFLLRFELMPRTVLTAAIIAIGAVSSSFPMLAISRILEKVSTGSLCNEIKPTEEATKKEAHPPAVKVVAARPIPTTEEEMGRAYDEYLEEMNARNARPTKK